MFERDIEDDDSDLTLGEVLSADEQTPKVRHVSTWGQWEERVRVLETPAIQRIEFESPYLRCIAKYARRAKH